VRDSSLVSNNTCDPTCNAHRSAWLRVLSFMSAGMARPREETR
jgi:hypothetical protein